MRVGCVGIAGLAILLTASCAWQASGSARVASALMPPAASLRDFTQPNRQGVLAYLTADPGWRAWLDAIAASDAAHSAMVDASTSNVPANILSDDLAFARDRYRRATSFILAPVEVRSGCLNLPSESAGAVSMPSGLVVRYSLLSSVPHGFANGSSCMEATGYVSEIDSVRGLPIVTTSPAGSIDWNRNFADALIWNQPFTLISQNGAYSVAGLLALIGQ
jgi:hypothetical protein